MEICWQFDYEIGIDKLRNLYAEAKRDQWDAARDLMMPALARVGAVTERSRELYADAGIPVWEDARRLEELENADTGEIEIPEAG